jgi:hypothetical protein
MEAVLTWTAEFPEAGPADVIVRTAGVATLDGLDRWTRAVLRDERRRPGMRLLVDHRRLDWSGFSREDALRRVDAVLAALDDAQASAIAVVLGSPLAYGLQRMMQAYSADGAERAGVRFGAFQSIEEAERWLEEQSLEPAVG